MNTQYYMKASMKNEPEKIAPSQLLGKSRFKR